MGADRGDDGRTLNMRNRWLLRIMTVIGCAYMFLGYTAAQQPEIDTIADIDGSCKSLKIAGHPSPCTNAKGIIYTHYRHGVVMLSVGVNDGRIMAFVAEKDAQPAPGDYWLYLARIRIGSNATQQVTGVGGTCKVSMSPDGMTWHSVICNAEDADGAKYGLSFVASKQPVHMRHFNASGQLTDTNSRIGAAIVTEVAQRFKQVLRSGGINGVSQDIQECYDAASENDKTSLRMCMLYDIAAIRFDQGMMVVLRARGLTPPAASNLFLSKGAFDARMQIYAHSAFQGGLAEAYSYFGNAPDTIVGNLNRN
jgi:hypothetical protein